MNDAHSFMDSDDEQYQDGSFDSHHDDQHHADQNQAEESWVSNANQVEPEGESHQPEQGFDNSFGGLVPQESRKERRRRLAMERDSQNQNQNNGGDHEVHGTDENGSSMSAESHLVSSHHEAEHQADPVVSKSTKLSKSPFAFASSLFKKKSRKSESDQLPTSEDPGSEQSPAPVEISLPMMATIDPALLYEYGLDPNTLGSMGIDPSSLPQFDPQFLNDLGINPNIVVDILRRQYGSTSEVAGETSAEPVIDKRQLWLSRFQTAKKWAPAAAAVVGLSATGAIWFMASGDDESKSVPKIAQADAAGQETDDETAENTSKKAISQNDLNHDSALAKAEPIPEQTAEPLPEPDHASALPATELTDAITGKPSSEIESPESALEATAEAAAPLAGLALSENLSAPAPPETPLESPPLPEMAAIGDAPPLPPVMNDLPKPPAEAVTEQLASSELPPISDLNKPITPEIPESTAIDKSKANELPPLVDIGVAAGGVEAAAATGLGEAPPLAAESLTGMPKLPIAASEESGPPELPGLPPIDSNALKQPSTDAVASAKSASADELLNTNVPSKPTGTAPELPMLGGSLADTKPETGPSGSSAKAPIAAGFAGLATGVGAAEIMNDQKAKMPSAPADLPQPHEPAIAENSGKSQPGLNLEKPKSADLPPLVTRSAAEQSHSIAVDEAGESDLPPIAGNLPKSNAVDLPNTVDRSLGDQMAKPGGQLAAESSATKNKAGIPLAQKDWASIPNGRGRVLRSIANSIDTGKTIGVAGTTAAGFGAGMAVSQYADQNGNVIVKYTEPVPPAQIAPIKHVVQSGENFWTISRDYYGSGRYYKALWSANSQSVTKIDQLHVGDSIRIPAMESLDKSLIESSSLTKNRNSTGSDNDGNSKMTRSLDSKAVRTGNQIESVPTRGSDVEIQSSRPSSSGPRREIISQPVGETSAKTSGRRHRVEAGETVRTIARDYLGDARRSNEIVSLNPDLLEDERTPLQSGQVLRMPQDSTDSD